MWKYCLKTLNKYTVICVVCTNTFSLFCRCIQIVIRFDAMRFDSIHIRWFFWQSQTRTDIMIHTYTVPYLRFYALLLENMSFSRMFAIKFTWTRTLRFSFRLMAFVSDIDSPWWKSRTVGTKQLFYRFARHPNWIASLPDIFKYGLWFYNVLFRMFCKTYKKRQTGKKKLYHIGMGQNEMNSLSKNQHHYSEDPEIGFWNCKDEAKTYQLFNNYERENATFPLRHDHHKFVLKRFAVLIQSTDWTFCNGSLSAYDVILFVRVQCALI